VAENTSPPSHPGGEVASLRVMARDARPPDAEAIAAIGSVAFPHAYAGVLHPAVIAAVVDQIYSSVAIADCIKRCLTTSDSQFLVAEQEGVIAGFLHFDCEGREPELHRIYTDPEKTGRGIGAALMKGLHSRLPVGSTYILMVLSDNQAAIRFYERCGLRRERTVDAVKHYRENMGFDAPIRKKVPGLVMRFGG
jgi:diamine N-acetyltransferase